MLHFFLGLWFSLRDVALAVLDPLAGRRRRRYRYAVTVDAPIDRVWPLLLPVETTFEKAGMHIAYEPIEGIDNGYVGHVSMGGRKLPAVAFTMERVEAPRSTVSRYLPEHSDPAAGIGADDVIGYDLTPLGDNRTRMQSFRELTHRSPATRITAPLGLRFGAWLIKQEAEGHAEAPATSLARRLANQGLIAALTLASFWYVAGLADALLIVLIIALHEAGHALAMLMTGVGVRMVTLVPFFGGMAVPKRPYDSEWKLAFVAWAGPGFSLLPTLTLVVLAASTQNPQLAHAALLFAVINGFNLLPIPPLDGGVMLNSLAGSLHRNLASAVLALGAATMLGLAIHQQSPIIGVAFLLVLLQLAYQLSLQTALQRRKLRWFEWPVVLTALLVTLGAYYALFRQAQDVERARFGPHPSHVQPEPAAQPVRLPHRSRAA